VLVVLTEVKDKKVKSELVVLTEVKDKKVKEVLAELLVVL
jgi:hypothetical protein